MLFWESCRVQLLSIVCEPVWLLQQENIIIKRCLCNSRLLPWRTCELILEIQVPAAVHKTSGAHIVKMHIVYSQQMCRCILSCTVCSQENTSRLSFPFPVCHALWPQLICLETKQVHCSCPCSCALSKSQLKLYNPKFASKGFTVCIYDLVKKHLFDPLHIIKSVC